MKAKMKAVVIHEHGGIDKLSYEEIIVPEIAANEILVEVKAVALNHLDLWVRQGVTSTKLNMPHILGSDVSGVVVEVGAFVKNVKVGDEVLLAPAWGCGSCEACLKGADNYCRHYKILGENVQGAYAEYVKLPGENAFLIPNGLNFEEAAAIPLVYLTAWHMLVQQAKVQPGEKILILAAGSGVGSAAIQIAKLFGAHVIATASTDAKLEKAKELGADITINYKQRDFLEAVKQLTNKKGV
ncbi:MAG: alcohol dehydrogenase catalytic domain-containing protein, partial [bacterium]